MNVSRTTANTRLWSALGVTASLLVACKPPDFQATSPTAISVKQGGGTTVTATIQRDEKFTSPVTVTFDQLPQGVQAAPAVIPEGKNSATVRVTATASAPTRTATPAKLIFTGQEQRHETPVNIAVKPLAGSLDQTFGKGGVVQMKWGVYLKRDHASTITVQNNGRILVGGQRNDHFTVSRFLPNGRVDTSFGQQGVVEVASAPGTIQELLLMKDGRVVAVGGNQYDMGPLTLARLTSEGSLDPTFGKKGVVTHEFNDYSLYGVRSAVLQSDGRTVVAGEAGTTPGGSGGITDAKSIVARFNEDGTVDRVFGNGGKVIGGPQEFGAVNGVALGPNDTILATGYTYNDWGRDVPEPEVFYVARYLSDGTTDASFGNSGYVTYTRRDPINDFTQEPERQGVRGTDVAVLSDGKVLSVANSWRDDPSTFREQSAIRVTRYLPDGARDPEFGEDGQVLIDFGYSASSEELVVTRDGYVLLGMVAPESSAYPSASVIRLTKDGAPDDSFNFDGRVGVGTLGEPIGLAMLRNGQVLSGTRLSPYFQDYDDNEDAARINVDLVKLNP